MAQVSKDLLPSSATAQERSLSETTARLSDVPVMVRQSWNPDTCPAALLPWLAWALSVDEWDTTWSEQEKRDVIKASFSIHKHKGTIGAVRRALTPLGYLIEVVEWWETTPKGDPYTFSIVMGTGSKPVTADLYEKAERIVLTYKNLRSHLKSLTVKADVRGSMYAGAALVEGVDTTIYPYAIRQRENMSQLFFATAGQDVINTTIYPAGWAGEAASARLTADGAQRLTQAGFIRAVEQ